MHALRKLLPYPILVITALLASSPIAAAAPVEVTDPGGDHCSTPTVSAHVGGQGCVDHIVGVEINLLQHINGVPTLRSSCNHEFALRIGANGEGWIPNPILTAVHTGIQCGPQPCTEPGGVKKPWHIQFFELHPGAEHAILRFCLTARINLIPTADCHLTGDLEIDVNGGPQYSFEAENKQWIITSNVAEPPAAQPNCNGFTALGPFEIDGHWTFEQQNILLVH